MKRLKLSKMALNTLFLGLLSAPCIGAQDMDSISETVAVDQAAPAPNYAPQASDAASCKTGNFYVGFSAGMEHVTSERSLWISTLDAGKGKSSFNGGVALVSGGYQLTWPQMIFAVEAYLGLSNANKKFTYQTPATRFSSELSKKVSLGVLARVGRPLGSFVPYVMAGFEVSRFAMTSRIEPTTPKVLKERAWCPALLIGGGVEKSLTPRTSLRLDYALSFYQTAAKRTEGQNPVIQKASKTQSHRVTLGLFYKF